MKLREIYVADLNLLLAAATQKLLEWPVLSAKTALPALRAAFDQHYAQTRVHLAQLEALLRQLDERPRPIEPDTFAAVAAMWRTRYLDADEGDLRELSLVTAAMALAHHTLPLYIEAIVAASATGDQEGAGVLQTALLEERGRTERMFALLQSLAPRLGAPGTTPDRSSHLMPGVWMTETTGFASVPPRANSDLVPPSPAPENPAVSSE